MKTFKLMALAIEQEEGKWQQILRTIDASNHYRGVKVTKSDLGEMIKNFEDNVLNQKKNELQVNYSHESHSIACGWITELRIKGRFLEAKIRWTPKAKEMIEDEEFRYFSAEFAPSWQDVETEEVFTNVLLGAALTNIPFVPGMKPVALSDMEGTEEGEIFLFTNHLPKMDFKQLLSALQGNKQVSLAEAKLMRVQFDALETEAKVEFESGVVAVETLAKENDAKITKASADLVANVAKLEQELADAKVALEAKEEGGDAKVTALTADLKESQETTKKLQSQVDILALERRTEVVTKKVEELSTAGKIFAKDAKATVELALGQGNVEKQDAFLAYLDNMPVKVDFSENGSATADVAGEDAKIKKINELADADFAVAGNKVSLADLRAKHTRELSD